MAATSPEAELAASAPDFTLTATDGTTVRLAEARGARGTMIVFMCNHCPYVKAIIDRLIRDAAELSDRGVSTIAICSNDAATHPEDGFDRMQAWATEKRFPFPYLHDESQAVARAYGAVCTPDFFGYDKDLKLRYRGRLDASRRDVVPDARRELFEAMKEIAEAGHTTIEQIPSMGCSIKWKAA